MPSPENIDTPRVSRAMTNTRSPDAAKFADAVNGRATKVGSGSRNIWNVAPVISVR